jgi:hypothetical protein
MMLDVTVNTPPVSLKEKLRRDLEYLKPSKVVWHPQHG